MAASREEVFERVKEVLTEQLGVEEGDINEEASFQEDLDADSLDLVELIMELEDQFGIKISDEDAQKIRRSGRQSTTSRRTSKTPKPLAELIDALPPERVASASSPTPRWATTGRESYERLEFLGDSRARARVAHDALRPFPRVHRGQHGEDPLARRLAASCAVVARELGLGERLEANATASASDELARLAANRNVLAAVLEAALAALYLEHGFERDRRRRRRGVRRAASSTRSRTTSITRPSCRSRSRARGRSRLYSVLDAEGPPHDRLFTAAASSTARGSASATGTSKKDAEQEAATRGARGRGSAPRRRRAAGRAAPPRRLAVRAAR